MSYITNFHKNSFCGLFRPYLWP